MGKALFAIGLIAVGSSGWAGEVDPAKIADLVARLGHESYYVRTPAQKELEQLTSDALPILARLYKESTDPEVRIRIEFFARERFVADLLEANGFDARGLAFLGIAYSAQIGEENAYIQVDGTIEDSGAQRAGIQPGDQIVAVDGQPLPHEEPRELTEYFSRNISGRKLFSRVKFVILRGSSKHEVEAVLTLRPVQENDSEERVTRLKNLKTLESTWWDRAFLRERLALSPEDRPKFEPLPTPTGDPRPQEATPERP